jgi:glycosyltransferase involved in cell wall biosynthesis
MRSIGSNPCVSIALPVYNGERYLPEALDSILAQSFADFELIICDNASTDRTGQISRDYGQRDGRVRYCRNDRNVGVAANFNLGFAHARGRYIKWAAYDDLMTPDYLGKCVALLEADPSLAVCHSYSDRIDAAGRQIGSYELGIPLDATRPSDRFYAMIWRENFPPIWGVMRSSLVRRTALYGPFVGSDRNFLAELLLHGGLAYVRERLFSIRIHPGAYLMQGRRSHAFRQGWYGSGMRYPSFMQLPVTAGAFAGALLRSRLPVEERLACWWHWSRWTGHCLRKLARRRMAWLRGAGNAEPITPAAA